MQLYKITIIKTITVEFQAPGNDESISERQNLSPTEDVSGHINTIKPHQSQTADEK